MVARLQSLRESATAAHVLPLGFFMALTVVPAMLRIENPELPWYQQAPEHWVYPVQTLMTGLLLLYFRRHYTFSPWRGLGLAGILAMVGIFIWIAPAWAYEKRSTLGQTLPEWLSWLGFVERKEGFNPDLLAPWPAWQLASVVMRFVRLVIIVPLIEEIFWRAFLMRYVAAGDRDWQQVPFGTHTWKSFAIVTLLVMVAHNPEDYLAAVVWGALVYFLAVRTRSLGACVMMHAMGNLLLGFYVLQTRQWGFW